MKLPPRLALEAFSMHLEFRHILDHQSKDVFVKEFRVCDKVTFSDFFSCPCTYYAIYADRIECQG